MTENTPPESEDTQSNPTPSTLQVSNSSSLSIDEAGRLKTPPPPKPKPAPLSTGFAVPTMMDNMFSKDQSSLRAAPEMPSSNGIDYPRAASWSSSTVADIMKDRIGKQVFRCFLHKCLAEENLLFVDEIDDIKKLQGDALKKAVAELLEKYEMYINISSSARAVSSLPNH